MEERLIPASHYQDVISAASDTRLLIASVQKLPALNLKILVRLIAFLRSLALQAENLMDARALAIVISPNLFETPVFTDEAELTQQLTLTQAETKIIEILIKELPVDK